ncbi:TetR/AcrR family transcriptional regulator [Pelosinus sp. UFO1]|uniref:TetR/AcrR family transcriptional regulator n=1 Tax=Pelosinus sp. UFO1 TaxID=484770 RepID=UPI0004D1CFD6|nr:TetR/AcrR family transcriptional regulator [Pelosinus sp. UFO1]AIF52925.1 transcriptional regulator, TetR family [Pelosinus sp. UFO1]
MNHPQYETKHSRDLKIKNHIFEVALTIMKEIGYENLTIRKICEVADISTGKFYSHFKSKEDLLDFYYVKTQESIGDIVKENLEGMDIEEQLITFYISLCKFTTDLGLDFCRNFFNPKNKEVNATFHNKVIETTNLYLENAIKNGLVISNGRTPYEVSMDLCVITKGVFFDWSANEGSYDMSEFMDGLLRRCLKGVL